MQGIFIRKKNDNLFILCFAKNFRLIWFSRQVRFVFSSLTLHCFGCSNRFRFVSASLRWCASELETIVVVSEPPTRSRNHWETRCRALVLSKLVSSVGVPRSVFPRFDSLNAIAQHASLAIPIAFLDSKRHRIQPVLSHPGDHHSAIPSHC